MFDGLRERIISIFTSRVTILYLIMVCLCGILLYRCFYLQIIRGQEFLDNFVLEQEKTRDIMPTRGNIYDRNGNLLAYNELAYTINIEDTFEAGSGKDAKLNDLIFRLVKLIEKNGDTIDSDFRIVPQTANLSIPFPAHSSGVSLLMYMIMWTQMILLKKNWPLLLFRS